MAISYGIPVYRDGETRVCYDALSLAVARADGWTDTDAPRAPAVQPEPVTVAPVKRGRPTKGGR